MTNHTDEIVFKTIKSLHEEFMEVWGLRLDDGTLRTLLHEVMQRRLTDYIESRTLDLTTADIYKVIYQLDQNEKMHPSGHGGTGAH